MTNIANQIKARRIFLSNIGMSIICLIFLPFAMGEVWLLPVMIAWAITGFLFSLFLLKKGYLEKAAGFHIAFTTYVVMFLHLFISDSYTDVLTFICISFILIVDSMLVATHVSQMFIVGTGALLSQLGAPLLNLNGNLNLRPVDQLENLVLFVTFFILALFSKKDSDTLLKALQSEGHEIKKSSSLIHLSSKPEPGPADFILKVTLDTLTDTVSDQIKNKNLKFSNVIDPKIPLMLNGEPDKLRQVLYILICNAVKYTDSGRISVLSSLVQKSQNTISVKFSVKDTGKGMTKKEIDLALSTARGVDPSLKNTGTKGSGLFLCNRLCHGMGGKLEIDNNEGKGSEFWFIAHFKPQQHVLKPKPASGDVDNDMDRLKAKRILIVGEQHIESAFNRNHFKGLGCTVGMVKDGASAMQLLKSAHENQHPYDLALINDELPDITGHQLGKKIKNHSEFGTIGLILNTDSPITDNAQENPSDIFCACITPSIEPEELLVTLKKSLIKTTVSDD